MYHKKMSKHSSSSHKFSFNEELEKEKSEFEMEVDLLFEEMNKHLEKEMERIKRKNLKRKRLRFWPTRDSLKPS